MKAILVLLGAATLTAIVCWPMTGCGFLADDYVFASHFHAISLESPGIWPAVKAAFVDTWSKDYEVFRPLTLLTLQLDWVLWGPDPGRHHLQSLAWWLLIALVFSDIVVRVTGRRDPWFRGLAFLLMGCCPSGVEALGWLVGRGCILRSCFTLLAVRSLLVRPDRPWRATPFVAAALCAYEQAVIVPFLLILIDAFLLPRPAGERLIPLGLRMARRHAATLVLLLVYFVVRRLLFGRVGSAYLSEGYMAWVEKPALLLAMLDRGATSLFRMVTPLSEAQVVRLLGDAPWIFASLQALLVLPPAWLLWRAWRRGRDPEGATPFGRLFRLVMLWLGLGIVLVLPIHEVSSNLLQGRWLILSTSGWLLLLMAAASRLDARGGREGRFVVAGLVLLFAVCMRVDLQSWVRASHQADLALRELNALPPKSKVAIFGLGRDGSSARTRKEITETDGIYGLSFGLFLATRPPFLDHAGVAVHMIRADDAPRLPEVLDGIGRGGGRAALARYSGWQEHEDGFARIRVVAPGGAVRPVPGLVPKHGETIPRTPFPTFQVRGRLPEAAVDGVRVAIVDTTGLMLEARPPLDAVGWTVRGERYRFEVSGKHFTPPLPDAMLEAHRVPCLVWWAELLSGERCVARAPYAVLRIAP